MSEDQAKASTISDADLLQMTTDICAAFVGNNSVPQTDVGDMIRNVHGVLSEIRNGKTAASLEPPTPAVPIKKSVQPDFLICLEDGKKMKMLKRHLRTAYNMTPDEYRQRWGLPHDYPMVAPAYAEKRSKLAKDIGLGTQRTRKR